MLEWDNYCTFETRGFISGNAQNSKFQIIEDHYIYFYEIDEDTYMPKLINVMFNFIKCSMMIIGTKSLYSIAFKKG